MQFCTIVGTQALQPWLFGFHDFFSTVFRVTAVVGVLTLSPLVVLLMQLAVSLPVGEE